MAFGVVLLVLVWWLASGRGDGQPAVVSADDGGSDELADTDGSLGASGCARCSPRGPGWSSRGCSSRSSTCATRSGGLRDSVGALRDPVAGGAEVGGDRPLGQQPRAPRRDGVQPRAGDLAVSDHAAAVAGADEAQPQRRLDPAPRAALGPRPERLELDDLQARSYADHGQLGPGLPEVGLLVLGHVDRQQARLPLGTATRVDEVGEGLLRRVRQLDGRGEAPRRQNVSPVSSS